jgi:hypothetical protein
MKRPPILWADVSKPCRSTFENSRVSNGDGAELSNPALVIASSWRRGSPRLLELMEQVAAEPGGMDHLVTADASSVDEEVVHALTFLLARAAGEAELATAIAPLVVQVMERISVGTPWARLNLCTAVDRLLMLKAVVPSLGRPLPGLGRLLQDALKGPDEVKAPALVVVNILHLRDMTDALAPEDLEWVRARARALRDSAHDEVADEARYLCDLLERNQRRRWPDRPPGGDS